MFLNVGLNYPWAIKKLVLIVFEIVIFGQEIRNLFFDRDQYDKNDLGYPLYRKSERESRKTNNSFRSINVNRTCRFKYSLHKKVRNNFHKSRLI